MKIILVLNRGAGTLRGVDPEIAAKEIAEIFRARGHEVVSEVRDGKDAVDAVRRACGDKGIDAVVVGGGDGSVSAAAAAAAECGTTLGILPLGTMNLFARSLGIPLDMHSAAEALADGAPDAVDIGEVNGRFFVHHIALGLHAKMVRTRERMTYASRFGKIAASVQAWWLVVRQPPRLDAEIRADKIILRRRTAGILVSNNPLGEGHLPYADDPSEGTLGLYVVTSRRVPDLIGLAIRVAVGVIAGNPYLEQRLAREVEVVLPQATVEASVDGEMVTLKTPIRCRSRRGGLSVIRPKETVIGT
jgi:diacylglycerol kinase family enzyme